MTENEKIFWRIHDLIYHGQVLPARGLFEKYFQNQTRRLELAEKLLIESKETVSYLKEYVRDSGLSAEDDCNEIIEKINNYFKEQEGE
jgi:hypothetical protein